MMHAYDERKGAGHGRLYTQARDVLATIDTTARVTAMLEAGRVSLDNGGAAVKILYDGRGENDCGAEPTGIRLEK